MSPRKIKAAMAAAWVALLGVIAWEYRVLVSLRGQAAERGSRRAGLRAEVDASGKSGAAAREAAVRLAEAIDKLRASRTAGTAAPEGGDLGFRGFVARVAGLRDRYLQGYAADLNVKWGRLFKKLGLSADQADKFKAIQMALEQTRLDLATEAKDRGVTMADPDLTARMNQANHDSNQAIHDLLGDTAYDAYRSYSQTLSALTLVNDLGNIGSMPQEPLTDSQVDQLTQILADSSKRDKYGWVVYGTVNWETANSAAESMLSPTQYQSLQSLETRKVAQWKLMRFLAGSKK